MLKHSGPEEACPPSLAACALCIIEAGGVDISMLAAVKAGPGEGALEQAGEAPQGAAGDMPIDVDGVDGAAAGVFDRGTLANLGLEASSVALVGHTSAP